MGFVEIAFGIILMILAAMLVVAVLMQSGKEKSLSGTIVGGAETFLGKAKGHSRDKVLGRITSILSVLFAILAVVMYIYITASVK